MFSALSLQAALHRTFGDAERHKEFCEQAREVARRKREAQEAAQEQRREEIVLRCVSTCGGLAVPKPGSSRQQQQAGSSRQQQQAAYGSR